MPNYVLHDLADRAQRHGADEIKASPLQPSGSAGDLLEAPPHVAGHDCPGVEVEQPSHDLLQDIAEPLRITPDPNRRAEVHAARGSPPAGLPRTSSCRRRSCGETVGWARPRAQAGLVSIGARRHQGPKVVLVGTSRPLTRLARWDGRTLVRPRRRQERSREDVVARSGRRASRSCGRGRLGESCDEYGGAPRQAEVLQEPQTPALETSPAKRSIIKHAVRTRPADPARPDEPGQESQVVGQRARGVLDPRPAPG